MVDSALFGDIPTIYPSPVLSPSEVCGISSATFFSLVLGDISEVHRHEAQCIPLLKDWDASRLRKSGTLELVTLKFVKVSSHDSSEAKLVWLREAPRSCAKSTLTRACKDEEHPLADVNKYLMVDFGVWNIGKALRYSHTANETLWS